jgi:hypothetical protein
MTKRLKTLIISMMVVLLSVILISENKATLKESKLKSEQSYTSYSGQIIFSSATTIAITGCNSGNGKLMKRGIVPYNSGYYQFQLDANDAIVGYQQIQPCAIY